MIEIIYIIGLVNDPIILVLIINRWIASKTIPNCNLAINIIHIANTEYGGLGRSHAKSRHYTMFTRQINIDMILKGLRIIYGCNIHCNYDKIH